MSEVSRFLLLSYKVIYGHFIYGIGVALVKTNATAGDFLSALHLRGFTPDFCENTILRYELAMMARICTNNLRVVLSP